MGFPRKSSCWRLGGLRELPESGLGKRKLGEFKHGTKEWKETESESWIVWAV
jgi:hypothetical protein